MNLLAGAFLLLGVVCVAIAAMYLFRRRAPAGGFYTDVDRAGSILGRASRDEHLSTRTGGGAGQGCTPAVVGEGRTAGGHAPWADLRGNSLRAHPYENASGSIKPVDITRTLEVMTADQKASGRTIQVPCDQQGKEAASR
jgi:hypothetical protein